VFRGWDLIPVCCMKRYGMHFYRENCARQRSRSWKPLFTI
jgi:hypothetical protein